MAEGAPGFEPERNEPRCYNCGLWGHMFMACPEDTRKIPAGLEASRARQQSNNSPRSDSPMNNKRNRGPVITRYPPPSNQPPPPPPVRFENPQGQPYPPGPVTGYPPHPQYSQGFGGQIPPTPQPPYDGYGPPGSSAPPGPPPPPPGAHQQFNPPPYHQAPYSIYGPSGSPPVPPPYGYHHGPPERPSLYPPADYSASPPDRSGQYPSAQYPPGIPYNSNQQYPPGPPQPYLPPPGYHPPQPGLYGYNGPPPAYPHSGYGLPPPPHYQQFPPSDHPMNQPYEEDRTRHQRVRDHHRRYDDKYPTEAWPPQRDWQAPTPPTSQNYRDFDYRESLDREGTYRDDPHPRKWERGRPRDDERSRDRRERSRPYRKPNKSDRHRRKRHHSVNTPARTVSREPSYLDLGGPTGTKAPQDPEPGEIVSQENSGSDRGDIESTSGTNANKDDEDFDWDLQTIFKEPPSNYKVDAIAAPLPTQYTDEVIIPPAFGANALKSKYINPNNVDDFALSIRDTKEWQIMRYHPAFLDPMEICLEALDTYDRVIRMERPFKNNRRDHHNNAHNFDRHRYGNPHGNSHGNSFNSSYGSGRFHGKNRDFHHRPNQNKRKWDEPHHNKDSYRTEKQYPNLPYDEPNVKKRKATPLEDGEVVETSLREPHNKRSRTPIAQVDDPERASEAGEVVEKPKPPVLNQSNGNSTSNNEAQRQRGTSLSVSTKDEADSQPRHPSPLPGIPLPYSRPSSRRSSKSFHRSRPGSRRSSFGGPMSEPGSPLDSIDRELLGMGRPSTSGSDTGNESPKRQFDNVTPKFKRRQPKGLEAYSRRW
ncbi:hypothetical protein F4779DRAFT_565164 [Xylariaceae sp. FL0662B]|nr:hypothetical protein F4779DRAFT_565164 [Xylariaceae sp. FL0662B]